MGRKAIRSGSTCGGSVFLRRATSLATAAGAFRPARVSNASQRIGRGLRPGWPMRFTATPGIQCRPPTSRRASSSASKEAGGGNAPRAVRLVAGGVVKPPADSHAIAGGAQDFETRDLVRIDRKIVRAQAAERTRTCTHSFDGTRCGSRRRATDKNQRAHRAGP